MTPLQIAIFALMAIVFVLWAFVWFRMLYALKSIADQRRRVAGVGYFGGIGITFGVFADFFVKSEHRNRRREVFAITVLLFAVILGSMFLLTPSG